jgi:hypothetical protein
MDILQSPNLFSKMIYRAPRGQMQLNWLGFNQEEYRECRAPANQKS